MSAIDSLAPKNSAHIRLFGYFAGFEERVHRGQENVTITAKWTTIINNKYTLLYTFNFNNGSESEEVRENP